MDRRDFVTATTLAALSLQLRQAKAQPRTQTLPATFDLTRRANQKTAAEAYLTGLKGGLGPAPLPYVFAHYDETQKKFLSPLEVTPTADASKSYSLTQQVYCFNISKSDQARFANLKNQVQLTMNATAPSVAGDLSWVFMNAIDIFGNKKSGPNQGTLTSFLQSTPNGQSGTSLQTVPKVTVQNGLVNLQMQVLGQKQDGFWSKFIHEVATLLGSQTVSTALTGFGIPSLTKDALQFVSHSLDVMTQNEKPVQLWSYGSFPFGIASNTKQRFRMCGGLWVLVDFDYAKKTNFLEDHTIDTKLQSFRLLDKGANLVDANFLVADMSFDLLQSATAT